MNWIDLKKKFLIVVFSVCIILLWSPALQAKAAQMVNVPVTVTQPDGQKLDIFASGDEFYNWLHDAQGYTILQDPNTGFYVYATLDDLKLAPTSHIVGRVNPAAVGLKPYLNVSPDIKELIRRSKRPAQSIEQGPAAPKVGTITNLVVFVRFSDESEFVTPLAQYTNLFNNTTAGANSMQNYYLEASYNALTIESDLFPTPAPNVISYQDPNPRSYYQPYNEATNPGGYPDSAEARIREHTLLRDAVAYVNGLGQFPDGATIDADNDGNIDSVTFIVSGSPDGWSDLLWPHKWTLFTYPVTINGKSLDEYAFQLNAVLETGVLAHEMFHVLGAPDLYHYVDDGINPVGGWDVMEYDANPPQHMGCYMKYKYGTWISSIPEITAPGTYSLNPLTSATNNCYKIASPYSTSEFFIVEYRQDLGTFESSLPGSGLLVYRINTLENGNASGPPDEVYIFRPDGSLAVNGNIAQANFNSTLGRDQINSVTNPATFLSNGDPGGLSLCNIGAAGGTISFDYGNCGAASFNASSHDFGDQLAGTTSGEYTFTLTNTSAGDLTISPLAASSDQFVLTNDQCSDQTLPPLDVCTFGVVFSPGTAGIKNGFVIVPSDDVNTPDVIRVTGNGTGLQSGPGFVVNSASDTDDGGCYIIAGGCTLREALNAASSGGSITFDPTLSGGTIALGSTLLLDKSLSIDGLGLASPVTISGDTNLDTVGDVRVFTVNAGVEITLNDLVIARGYNFSLGGGIYNSGTITATRVTFSNNQVDTGTGHWGGAIYSVGAVTLISSTLQENQAYIGGAIAINTGGSLNISGSTFLQNVAVGSGGAIYTVGPASVTGSTFELNTASSGGAIRQAAGTTLNVMNSTFMDNSTTGGTGGSGWGGAINNSGTTNVSNSTFTRNTSYAGGGVGINSGGTLTLVNTTLSGNTALFGGGLYNNGTLNYANSILAHSVSGGDCRTAGTLGINARNLVQDGFCSPALSGDPGLGLLQDNGGNTDTMALEPDSPAIDAGDATACANPPVDGQDQRGQNRDDYLCDLGAVELALSDSSIITRTITGTGDFTFGPTMVKVTINNTGACLTGITIQRSDTNHPSATPALQTGHWWDITPIGCTSGFDVDLTLPADFTPDVNDKVCRWNPGSGWDCLQSTFTTSSVTRSHVTGFSEWAVGNDSGPTALVLTRFATGSQDGSFTPPAWLIIAGWVLASLMALFLLNKLKLMFARARRR